MGRSAHLSEDEINTPATWNGGSVNAGMRLQKGHLPKKQHLPRVDSRRVCLKPGFTAQLYTWNPASVLHLTVL